MNLEILHIYVMLRERTSLGIFPIFTKGQIDDYNKQLEELNGELHELHEVTTNS